MIDFEKSYLGKNLNSISQLGNTLCDGGVDISISGRIGYNCLTYPTAYWLKLQNRVDKTFELIGEKDHCLKAYKRDKGEDYSLGGTKKQLIALKVLVYVATFILRILLRFKKPKPKKYLKINDGIGGRPDDRTGKGGG